MNEALRELYQEVILDHSRRPRNRGQLAEDAVHVHGDNPSCGDEIDLWVKFDPSGTIEDLKFSGSGCAISQAAASMMTVKSKGRSKEDALSLLGTVQQLLTAKEAPTIDLSSLGELGVLEGVRQFPQRVKCAMLGWRALEAALKQQPQGTVSTEEGEA